MNKILSGVALVIMVSSLCHAQDSKQQLQLTIRSDKQMYDIYEDVVVTLNLKNNSDKVVWINDYFKDIDSIGHRSNFHFQVFKDQSRTEQQYKHIELFKKMVVPFEKLSIKPGTEIVFKATLNEWYNFINPGLYLTTCYYSSLNLTSNTITIEVKVK